MPKLFLLLSILVSILSATAQNPSGIKPGPVKPGAASLNPAKPSPAQATPTIADTAIHFADSIFHTPFILYEEVQAGIPRDIQLILVRFNNAMVANRTWFEQYKNTYAGQPLPFNQRFGISPDEYKRLQSLSPQLVPVDTQKVIIIREAGYIRFHGVDSSFQLLDYLQIDLKKQLLVYGADTIPLIGRTATTATSPYGEWQGFTWRLEKADANSMLTSGSVTARVIEINMGLTTPSTQQAAPPTQAAVSPAQAATLPTQAAAASTQTTPSTQQNPSPAKVFLRVKYQQMKEGTTTANLEMVGYVQH